MRTGELAAISSDRTAGAFRLCALSTKLMRVRLELLKECIALKSTVRDTEHTPAECTRRLNVVPAVFFGVFYSQEGGFHGKG